MVAEGVHRRRGEQGFRSDEPEGCPVRRRTAEYTPRRDVSVADAVPIRRRSGAPLTPAFVTQRAGVRRRGHARLGRQGAPQTGARPGPPGYAKAEAADLSARAPTNPRNIGWDCRRSSSADCGHDTQARGSHRAAPDSLRRRLLSGSPSRSRSVPLRVRQCPRYVRSPRSGWREALPRLAVHQLHRTNVRIGLTSKARWSLSRWHVYEAHQQGRRRCRHPPALRLAAPSTTSTSPATGAPAEASTRTGSR